MKSQWVKDLKAGMNISSSFGVCEIGLARNKHGASYLRLVSCDKTGKIEARVWNPTRAESLFHEIAAGDIVGVNGCVEEFNGELQISIESCVKPGAGVSIDIANYCRCTQQDINLMLDRFMQFIEQVRDPSLHELLVQCFNPDILAQFSRATAGKTIHHAYIGGLLEHTLEVLEYCRKISDTSCPGVLNTGLLLTGGALHDIGKLWEYKQVGFAFDITDTSRLLGGHILIGHDYVRKVIGSMDFPEQLAVLVDHLILSHPGKREWGAAEEPHTLEAVALFHADLLSARMNHAAQLVINQDGPGWTAKGLNVGSLYVPGD